MGISVIKRIKILSAPGGGKWIVDPVLKGRHIFLKASVFMISDGDIGRYVSTDMTYRVEVFVNPLVQNSTARDHITDIGNEIRFFRYHHFDNVFMNFSKRAAVAVNNKFNGFIFSFFCVEGMNNTTKACAYYERIYVMYGRYKNWVAKAYVQRAKCLKNLREYRKAYDTLHEMLQDEDLSKYPEWKEAERNYRSLEARL